MAHEASDVTVTCVTAGGGCVAGSGGMPGYGRDRLQTRGRAGGPPWAGGPIPWGLALWAGLAGPATRWPLPRLSPCWT